jgi:rare lipoprotein A (peptidoglycan hydrolase)
VLLGTVLLALLFPNSDNEAVRGAIEVRKAEEVEAPPATRKMVASYYGPGLRGNPTASGEPFDPQEYTAAHKSLPLGTKLIVSYGGESVRVTVNDRGPYAPGHDLDLSLAAAREIGLTDAGTAPVRVILP